MAEVDLKQDLKVQVLTGVGLCLEHAANDEDSHRHERLEHLDEGDRKVEVGGIAKPQGPREESTDRYDGLHVCVSGHVHGGHVSQAHTGKGQEAGEAHVPHRQGDREGKPCKQPSMVSERGCKDIFIPRQGAESVG